MKRFRINPVIALITIIGALAVWKEWQPVKVETLWKPDMASIAMGLLYLVTFIVLIMAIRQWKKGHGKAAFTACGVALAFIALIWGQRWALIAREAEPDVFSARAEGVGGDGALYLSFKKGHYVTAQKQDQWTQTFYRGSYSRQGDTLELDIPLDFPLGKRAVIEGDTLRFLNPPAFFYFIPSH